MGTEAGTRDRHGSLTGYIHSMTELGRCDIQSADCCEQTYLVYWKFDKKIDALHKHTQTHKGNYVRRWIYLTVLIHIYI